MATGNTPPDAGASRTDISSTASLLGGDPEIYGEAAPEGLDLGDEFEGEDDGGTPPANEPDRAPKDEGRAGEGDDADSEKTPGDDAGTDTGKGVDDGSGQADKSGEKDSGKSEKDDAAEKTAGEPGSDDKPAPKIPPWRLNQQAEKTRNYEAMLRANGIDPSTGKPFSTPPAPAQQPPADPEPDKPDPRLEKIDAAWDEYDAAAIDGDSEKMKAARASARALEREVDQERFQKELDQRTQQTTDEASAQARVQQALPAVLEQYSFLDDKSQDFSREMLQETIQLRDLYTGQGMDVVDAINKAAHFVSNGYGYESTAASGKPAEGKPAEGKPAEGESAEDETAGDKTPQRDASGRFKQSVDKKVEAASRQPPKPAKGAARNDSELPRVSQMSERQWDELDDESRSDLLGDNG